MPTPIADIEFDSASLTLSGPSVNNLAVPDTYNHYTLVYFPSAATITGIAKTKRGRPLWLTSTRDSFTLSHNSASSTQGNRFWCPGETDLVLGNGESVMMVYDHENSRWAVFNSSALASGGGTTTHYYPLWAEENSSLGANAHEWAFGNGANTPDGSGVVMPVAYEIVAMGLTTGSAGTCAVRAERTPAGSTTSAVFSPGAQVSTSSSRDNLVSFAAGLRPTGLAGDKVNFQTVTASGSGSPCQVVLYWNPR